MLRGLRGGGSTSRGRHAEGRRHGFFFQRSLLVLYSRVYYLVLLPPGGGVRARPGRPSPRTRRALRRGRGQRASPGFRECRGAGAPGAGHRWSARGALRHGCVLGSIGGPGTGGADIATYTGGMQGGGGGVASQSQGLVRLLGALGGRASVRGQEAGGRGEARPRRSSGRHCPGHWLGVPGGRCAGVLRCVQVTGLGRGPGPLLRRRPPGAGSSHIPHRVGGGARGAEGGRGPWADPDTGCARASTESGPRARAAPGLPIVLGAAVHVHDGERGRSGSRGERRARRTGGGPKRQGA